MTSSGTLPVRITAISAVVFGVGVGETKDVSADATELQLVEQGSCPNPCSVLQQVPPAPQQKSVAQSPQFGCAVPVEADCMASGGEQQLDVAAEKLRVSAQQDGSVGCVGAVAQSTQAAGQPHANAGGNMATNKAARASSGVRWWRAKGTIAQVFAK